MTCDGKRGMVTGHKGRIKDMNTIDSHRAAKNIRLKYGRGWKSWDDAKAELLKLGFAPEIANKILLGTKHLLGD